MNLTIASKGANVVFNLAGTLIDSEPQRRFAISQLLAEQGRRAQAAEEVAPTLNGGVEMHGRRFRPHGRCRR